MTKLFNEVKLTGYYDEDYGELVYEAYIDNGADDIRIDLSFDPLNDRAQLRIGEDDEFISHERDYDAQNGHLILKFPDYNCGYVYIWDADSAILKYVKEEATTDSSIYNKEEEE